MDIASLIQAISSLAWPVLVLAALIVLLPSIKRIIESRRFTVKLGNMEISVQEASDQFRNQIEDLQRNVDELRAFQATLDRESQSTLTDTNLPAADESSRTLSSPRKEIVWVDDNPQNNAYEIARLEDEDYSVIQARTTSEAQSFLRRLILAPRPRLRAIITDMGRVEDGQFIADAGLRLIRIVRQIEAEQEGQNKLEVSIPIFVYTTTKQVNELREAVLEAGGDGITASPIELFSFIDEPHQRVFRVDSKEN